MRHLSTRRSFQILALTVVFTGCRSTSGSTPESNLRSADPKQHMEFEHATETFSEVSETEFNTQRAGTDAEFLGCLCVSEDADRSKWSAWQFLTVGSKGFRTTTDKVIYLDLEECVTMRETLMECEG